MKTFKINLQTTLFLSENSVLAAYNEHTGILVYNKPIVSVRVLEEITQQVKDRDLKINNFFQTDSFGVNFYDHLTGGTSSFHDIKAKL